VLGPVVAVALGQRAAARTRKDFAASDAVRDGLAEAGIEVRDTPDGQVWELRPTP
jgi:cysteinyl-tRNA synthetase